MDQVVLYNQALNQFYVANDAIYSYTDNCYLGTIQLWNPHIWMCFTVRNALYMKINTL